jgi:hypothetical protein
MARNTSTRPTSDAREWLILALGVVTTGFGVTYTTASANSNHPSVASQVVAGVLTAVGGGILGAVISILVARSSDRDTLAHVAEVLERSLTSELRSDDRRLSPLRAEQWHHYYLTTLRGEHVWRYEKYPFQLSAQVGSLAVEVDVVTDNGNVFPYLVEAFVRHERLTIVSSKARDNTNVFVEVFPQFDGELSEYFGIGFVRTWDATNIVTKTILSQQPLKGITGTGPTLSADDGHQLDAIWKTGFQRLNDVLPTSS